MLHITMRNMEANFKTYRGFFNCHTCDGIVWFFRNDTIPSHCPYCRCQFFRMFGLVNGFAFAKTRYYECGEE